MTSSNCLLFHQQLFSSTTLSRAECWTCSGGANRAVMMTVTDPELHGSRQARHCFNNHCKDTQTKQRTALKASKLTGQVLKVKLIHHCSFNTIKIIIYIIFCKNNHLIYFKRCLTYRMSTKIPHLKRYSMAAVNNLQFFYIQVTK